MTDDISEGDEAYWGTYAVTVGEVQPGLHRAYVEVNKSNVDWEGYVDLDQLSEEKDEDSDVKHPFDDSTTDYGGTSTSE